MWLGLPRLRRGIGGDRGDAHKVTVSRRFRSVVWMQYFFQLLTIRAKAVACELVSPCSRMTSDMWYRCLSGRQLLIFATALRVWFIGLRSRD
jgi:hypothetical protein